MDNGDLNSYNKKITEYDFNVALEENNMDILSMIKETDKFDIYRPVKLLENLRKFSDNKEFIKLLVKVSTKYIKESLNYRNKYSVYIDIFIELLEINDMIDIEEEINYITEKIEINDAYKFYIDQIFKTDFKAKKKIEEYRKKYNIKNKYDVINNENKWYLANILENFLRRNNKEWSDKIMEIIQGKKNNWGNYYDGYITGTLSYLFYNHTNIDKLIEDTNYVLTNSPSYKNRNFHDFSKIFNEFHNFSYSNSKESRFLEFIFKTNKNINKYCEYLLNMINSTSTFDISDILRNIYI